MLFSEPKSKSQRFLEFPENSDFWLYNKGSWSAYRPAEIANGMRTFEICQRGVNNCADGGDKPGCCGPYGDERCCNFNTNKPLDFKKVNKNYKKNEIITITKSESIRFTNKAWLKVSASAIVNCWRKADIIENISKNVQNDIVKLAKAFETFSFLNKDYEAEDKLIGTLAELNIYLNI